MPVEGKGGSDGAPLFEEEGPLDLTGSGVFCTDLKVFSSCRGGVVATIPGCLHSDALGFDVDDDEEEA